MVSAVRRVLRILAVVVLIAAAVLWLVNGASRSLFTKTSIPVKAVDATTGLERVDWKPGFEPGIDFLVASGMAALLLAGGSFLFRKKKTGT
jgi:LPXTG-motif cell wall-anchored protein